MTTTTTTTEKAYAPASKHVVVDYNQPHWERRAQILKLHPDVKQLFGKDPFSALWVILLVATQFVVAYLIALVAVAQQQQQHSLASFSYSTAGFALENIALWCANNASFWLVFSVSVYFIGATIDHALWVLIHDLGHNLAFNNRKLNQFFMCLANVPHVLPSAVSFRHYHRLHHGHLNEAYDDPDVAEPFESDFVGNSALFKMLWLLFFPFVQLYRAGLYVEKAKQRQQQQQHQQQQRKRGKIADLLFSLLGFDEPEAVSLNYAMNLGLVASFAIACYSSTGCAYATMHALAYLLFSLFFSVGLHPLGARWIAEHYAVSPPQETYSYYGSLNLVAFNIGYHNEHHDFPSSIPWSRLPELRKLAPEFYEPLYKHSSYTKLLWNFIFDNRITLSSRVVRPGSIDKANNNNNNNKNKKSSSYDDNDNNDDDDM